MRRPAFKTNINILLIEDTLSDAALVRAFLQDAETESERFNCSHATNLSRALPLLSSNNLHAVILDLMLPDTDELDGLMGIQSLAPDLPILILTGRDDELLANKAVVQGAQDYLFKDRITGPSLIRSLRYAIHRKQHLGAIVRQANFDSLSGLPNRDMFLNRLELAMAKQQRTKQKIGLLMLDLNGFKAINDTYGHDAGDVVLREVGQRIPLCLRPYDMAARLGGDEFVVLIEEVRPPCDYAAIATKLIDTIERPLIAGGAQVSVGVSIGIALADGTNDAPAETLLRQADNAMYRAKANKDSAFAFFKDSATPYVEESQMRRTGS